MIWSGMQSIFAKSIIKLLKRNSNAQNSNCHVNLVSRLNWQESINYAHSKHMKMLLERCEQIYNKVHLLKIYIHKLIYKSQNSTWKTIAILRWNIADHGEFNHMAYWHEKSG